MGMDRPTCDDDCDDDASEIYGATEILGDDIDQDDGIDGVDVECLDNALELTTDWVEDWTFSLESFLKHSSTRLFLIDGRVIDGRKNRASLRLMPYPQARLERSQWTLPLKPRSSYGQASTL